MTSNFAGIVYIKKANCSDHLVPGSSQTWVFALSLGMEDSEESDITSTVWVKYKCMLAINGRARVFYLRQQHKVFVEYALLIVVLPLQPRWWNHQAQPQSSVAMLLQRSTRPICKLTWRTAIRLSTRNSCKRTIDRKLRRQRWRKQRLRNPWVLYEPKCWWGGWCWWRGWKWYRYGSG